MGMDACVIGIGPFSHGLVKYMDYPSEYYEEVPEGAAVFVTFFQCNATFPSRLLAQALGIEDCWDFEKHPFDRNSGREIDWELLQELQEGSEWGEEEIEGFKVCFDAGFKFFYLPNG